MPKDTPKATSSMPGAGRAGHADRWTHHDCGARSRSARRPRAGSMFRRSRSLIRVEGKKTLGYELAEQLEWRSRRRDLPTGGAPAFVGMWKVFDEMNAWAGSAASARGCSACKATAASDRPRLRPGREPRPPSMSERTRRLRLGVPRPLATSSCSTFSGNPAAAPSR